ncbi:MAG TPA: AAA family ATPase, partial [Bacillota bacterium]|nr:AAA family ATPase [Bacillota bacterium]
LPPSPSLASRSKSDRLLAGDRPLAVTVWIGTETPAQDEPSSAAQPRIQRVEVRGREKLLLSYCFVAPARFRYGHVEPCLVAPWGTSLDRLPQSSLQLAEGAPAYEGDEIRKQIIGTIAAVRAWPAERVEELKRHEYQCEGSWVLSALDARRRRDAQARVNAQADLDRQEPMELGDESWECGVVELDSLRHELAEQLFARPLVHVGPLRRCPPRFLAEAIGGTPTGVPPGVSWERIANSVSVRAAVNEGLQQIGLQYQLESREWRDSKNPRRYLRELLLLDSHGRELGPRDVGFGVSQVIPVISEALGRESSLVAIEQPELHLHPAQQSELGDIFLKAALPAGETRNQFILETHSEHLILRIMRRIRETHLGKLPKEKNLPPVRPSDVAVLYVEKEGPRSIVREFPLNERGELVKAWPGGFFEEGLREMLS